MKSKPIAPKGKPYGISVELPEGDPMSAPHLLGDEWSGTRWFSTAEERDGILESMKRQPAYYRKGDTPSIRLDVINP